MSSQKGTFIVLPIVIVWDEDKTKRYIPIDNKDYKETTIRIAIYVLI